MKLKCLLVGHQWRRRFYNNKPVVCKSCSKSIKDKDFVEKDLEKTAWRFYKILIATMLIAVTFSFIVR